MNYQTFAPPESLKPFIKHFWSLTSDIDNVEVSPLAFRENECPGVILTKPGNNIGNSITTLRAFPDGCPGVMMVQSETALCTNENKKLPEIFLHGQTTKTAELNYSGRISAIGINFQPYALQSIFGINANELTNTGIDIAAVQAKKSINLCEQLANEETVEGRIKMLSNYLLYQHQHNNIQTDEVVKYAVAQILQGKGTLPLKELHQKLQLSERSLERKFNQAIGISPKLFSRICRFQESFKQLQAGSYDKLSDIAYENEYSDQSYFIRAFKEFTGFSPLEFKKQL